MGHIFSKEESEALLSFTIYSLEELINTGWAEEVRETTKTVWELKEGDKYTFIRNDGGKTLERWDELDVDKNRRKYNHCFLTPEDADMELLRRESRAKAWMPEVGQNFWSIDSKGKSFESIWEGDYIDMMYFHNGHAHKTEKESIEWGEKYGKAF